MPCGQGRHIVRWEAGALRLPSHPDPEAELVLAALGGEKARCVELAEAWGRHAADLTVFRVGPRGPADEIVVSWDDVDAAQASGRGGWVGYAPGPQGRPSHGPMRLASPPPAAARARALARQQQQRQETEQATRRRNDMLSLLALGYGFQVRLIGQVAQAHADLPDETMETVRPSLVAAISGRLAPVAEEWLGIDPDQVVVSLHRGPGWGSVEPTGRGEERRLRVARPAGWLAWVWAAGLALAGRHLVVAVGRGGWPDARVLALRAPGTEPVLLDVHARAESPIRGSLEVRPSAADAPHWELSAPLANRLCHLAWQTDPRSVADGLAGGWAAPVVPVLPEGWQAEEILSRGSPRSCTSGPRWPAHPRPTPRPRDAAGRRRGPGRWRPA